MGECLQSRLDKLGQMRVLDMHAHLAFLTGSGTEKWEQKKMAAYEAGKKELDFRYQNGIATCLSSGTPAELGVHKTVPKQRGAAAELWNPSMVCRSASDRGNAGGIQRV